MENFQQPLTGPVVNGTIITELTALRAQSAEKIHYSSKGKINCSKISFSFSTVFLKTPNPFP